MLFCSTIHTYITTKAASGNAKILTEIITSIVKVSNVDDCLAVGCYGCLAVFYCFCFCIISRLFIVGWFRLFIVDGVTHRLVSIGLLYFWCL